MDQEIVGILRGYAEIVNGWAYARDRDAALANPKAAVRSHLENLGYTVPG
jgi:hypothetical protein